MAARHVRRGPGFVDEDQPVRVEVELSVEPVETPLQDVRAILLLTAIHSSRSICDFGLSADRRIAA